MINDYTEGGLEMIDIESYNKSLKSFWIKKYLDIENSSGWKSFFDLELQSYGGKAIFLGNLIERTCAVPLRYRILSLKKFSA